MVGRPRTVSDNAILDASARARHDSPLAAFFAALAALVADIETPATMANHLAFLQLASGDSSRLAQAVYTTYNGALLTWAIDGRGPLGDWLRDAVSALLAPSRAGAEGARGSAS